MATSKKKTKRTKWTPPSLTELGRIVDIVQGGSKSAGCPDSPSASSPEAGGGGGGGSDSDSC